MSGTNFLEKATEIVRQATAEDSKENYEEALRLYMNSLEYFMAAIKYERNEKTKETVRKKITEYLGRAEILKQKLKEPKKKAVDAAGGKYVSWTSVVHKSKNKY